MSSSREAFGYVDLLLGNSSPICSGMYNGEDGKTFLCMYGLLYRAGARREWWVAERVLHIQRRRTKKE
jgi:hypothetical protein